MNVEELKVLATTERDALQARVGELEAAIGALSVYVPCAVWGESVLPCLARTPAQSVAHIEAAVLRGFCEEMEGKALYVGGDATGGVLWICKKGRERADRIEQAAKS